MHTSRHRPLRALALIGAVFALLLGPQTVAAFDCAPAPRDDCRGTTRPQKSKLNLRNGARPDKQKMVWKWFRGEATPLADYGDPITTDDYALCMYGGDDDLEYQAVAPAGASCRPGSCWKRMGDRGFAFRDGQALHDGLTKIRLYRGEEGRARIVVKGAGAYLDLAALPLKLPTVVQLQASHGPCWEATFSAEGARRNDATRFGGRSSLP